MAYKPFGGYVARRPDKSLKGYGQRLRVAKPCSTRVEGDECACHCGLRWPFAEAKPECPSRG